MITFCPCWQFFSLLSLRKFQEHFAPLSPNVFHEFLYRKRKSEPHLETLLSWKSKPKQTQNFVFWTKIRPIWAGRHSYFIRMLTKYLIKITKPQENSYWGHSTTRGQNFAIFWPPHLVHVVIEWLLVTYNLINSRDIFSTMLLLNWSRH